MMGMAPRLRFCCRVDEDVRWVLGLGLTRFTGWRFGCLGYELSARFGDPSDMGLAVLIVTS